MTGTWSPQTGSDSKVHSILVSVILDSSMTQKVSANMMSCMPSMVVGKFVPVNERTNELVSNEKAVISASGAMYAMSQVMLWHTAGFPSTVTIN